jgi:hypothetical protein
MDTPGLVVERNIPVMDHQALEGHCEIVLRDVRVPADHLLGTAGAGFAMAQARLGPGRVHHAMRSIGQCELALELMCERALERRAFGMRVGDFANVQDWIAHSRLEIDQARLLVLRAAWKMDREGPAVARVDASAIKLVTAQLQTRVVDRAIQLVTQSQGAVIDQRPALLNQAAALLARVREVQTDSGERVAVNNESLVKELNAAAVDSQHLYISNAIPPRLAALRTALAGSCSSCWCFFITSVTIFVSHSRTIIFRSSRCWWSALPFLSRCGACQTWTPLAVGPRRLSPLRFFSCPFFLR